MGNGVTIFKLVIRRSLMSIVTLLLVSLIIFSMLEVLLASLVAWVWLGETLSAAQLVGGGIVLAGVVLAQTAR